VAAARREIGSIDQYSDAKLQAAVSKYAGPKGNLRFPLDAPIPYALVARIVRFRVKQDLAKARKK